MVLKLIVFSVRFILCGVIWLSIWWNGSCLLCISGVGNFG